MIIRNILKNCLHVFALCLIDNHKASATSNQIAIEQEGLSDYADEFRRLAEEYMSQQGELPNLEKLHSIGDTVINLYPEVVEVRIYEERSSYFRVEFTVGVEIRDIIVQYDGTPNLVDYFTSSELLTNILESAYNIKRGGYCNTDLLDRIKPSLTEFIQENLFVKTSSLKLLSELRYDLLTGNHDLIFTIQDYENTQKFTSDRLDIQGVPEELSHACRAYLFPRTNLAELFTDIGTYSYFREHKIAIYSKAIQFFHQRGYYDVVIDTLDFQDHRISLKISLGEKYQNTYKVLFLEDDGVDVLSSNDRQKFIDLVAKHKACQEDDVNYDVIGSITEEGTKLLFEDKRCFMSLKHNLILNKAAKISENFIYVNPGLQLPNIGSLKIAGSCKVGRILDLIPFGQNKSLKFSLKDLQESEAKINELDFISSCQTQYRYRKGKIDIVYTIVEHGRPSSKLDLGSDSGIKAFTPYLGFRFDDLNFAHTGISQCYYARLDSNLSAIFRSVIKSGLLKSSTLKAVLDNTKLSLKGSFILPVFSLVKPLSITAFYSTGPLFSLDFRQPITKRFSIFSKVKDIIKEPLLDSVIWGTDYIRSFKKKTRNNIPVDIKLRASQESVGKYPTAILNSAISGFFPSPIFPVDTLSHFQIEAKYHVIRSSFLATSKGAEIRKGMNCTTSALQTRDAEEELQDLALGTPDMASPGWILVAYQHVLPIPGRGINSRSFRPEINLSFIAAGKIYNSLDWSSPAALTPRVDRILMTEFYLRIPFNLVVQGVLKIGLQKAFAKVSGSLHYEDNPVLLDLSSSLTII